ncbi:MAG: polysaccharide pyruvyl transferase family protein, partial [Candidatus Margulisiibacteriota bacterium]
TVRDEDSYQSLLNLGIKSSLLHLTADPSVILKVSPWEGQKILSLEGIPSGKPLLGISVRSIPGRPDLEKKIFEVLAKVVDYLEENYNYQPVFLPFECPEDLGEAKKVMDLMKGNPKIIFRICRPSEMLAVISQMDLLIGMRLHSLIFAAKSKVAFLGISYDPKVKAFAKTFGLPFLEVEPEFNFETIREKIAKIICEKDSIKELLASKMDIIYHLAEENFELLAKLIALEK